MKKPELKKMRVLECRTAKGLLVSVAMEEEPDITVENPCETLSNVIAALQQVFSEQCPIV